MNLGPLSRHLDFMHNAAQMTNKQSKTHFHKNGTGPTHAPVLNGSFQNVAKFYAQLNTEKYF